MKGYNGNTFIAYDRCSNPRRNQVRACVQTSSWAKLAALVGESAYSCRIYWSSNLNDDMITALSGYPPDTVLVRPLDFGNTVDGQTGWVPL